MFCQIKKYFVCILSTIINQFVLFKKGYTYGEILLFLYNRPENRCRLRAIKRNITDVDITYFIDVIKWLLKDELIVYERHHPLEMDPEFADVFRISYKGFVFIKDLKEKRNSRITNSIAICIAALSVCISSIVNINNSNKTNKIEIVKFPYRDSIKKDIAPPIANPWITPWIMAGKSSLPQGSPK